MTSTTLELHKTYTSDEAVVGLAKGGPVDSYCDGQFRVASDVILCFFPLGGPPFPSKLSTPLSLEWRPLRLDYHPSEDLPWFPLAAREIHPNIGRITSGMNASEWLRLQSQQVAAKRLLPKKHHVFLRRPADCDYLYAGPAHLAGYSMSPKDPNARFDLASTLPREAWLRFGGYEGWLVDVNHSETQVGKNDVLLFESLLATLRKQKYSHFELTRYEEDALHVYINSRRAWLMYLRKPGDAGLYIRNSDKISEQRERFKCDCGIDLEFPADQTLSKQEALDVAKEFFLTGRLPANHSWAEEI